MYSLYHYLSPHFPACVNFFMGCSTTLTVAQAALLLLLRWRRVLGHDAVYGTLVMADVVGSSETSPPLPDYTSSDPNCEPQNVWCNCWTVKGMKRSDGGPIWGAVPIFLEGLKKSRSSIRGSLSLPHPNNISPLEGRSQVFLLAQIYSAYRLL